MGIIAKRRNAAKNRGIAAPRSTLTALTRAEVIAELEAECRIANYDADARLELQRTEGNRLQKWAAPETARADQYHIEEAGNEVLVAYGATPARFANAPKHVVLEGPWLARITYTAGTNGKLNSVESTLLRWYSSQEDGNLTNRHWYLSLVQQLFERIQDQSTGDRVPIDPSPGPPVPSPLRETTSPSSDPDTQECLRSVRAHERAHHENPNLQPAMLVLAAKTVALGSDRWQGPVPIVIGDSVLVTSRKRWGARTSLTIRRSSFSDARPDGEAACVFDLKDGTRLTLSFGQTSDRDAVLAWAQGGTIAKAT
jgi:hypothetical protein